MVLEAAGAPAAATAVGIAVNRPQGEAAATALHTCAGHENWTATVRGIVSAASAVGAGILVGYVCAAAFVGAEFSRRSPDPKLAVRKRREDGSGVRGALADAKQTVQESVKKDVLEPQKHGVLCQCMPAGFLEDLFPRIKAVFKPHVVKYNNTNAYIQQQDADKSGTGGTQEQVDWKVSSYMELDPSLGGQMQKQVDCDLELRSICLPMLEKCDDLFTSWYRSKKGDDSIHELVRLQSFITRYRVRPDESSGLLRHIDGVQVDGSLILALPTDQEWRGHGYAHAFEMRDSGGVTVWEGPEEDEVQWDYPMEPGDMCFLDNYVWHQVRTSSQAQRRQLCVHDCLGNTGAQGNPITAGERWALVIFYRTKRVKGTRFSRMFLKAAAERKRKEEAAAAAGAAADKIQRQVTAASK